MSAWTVERVDRLKAMWAGGLTASRIGKELGLGRNVVIGKAHRLGLPTRTLAQVGRHAERQDPEEGLGPKDEHAVGEADAPSTSPLHDSQTETPL